MSGGSSLRSGFSGNPSRLFNHSFSKYQQLPIEILCDSKKECPGNDSPNWNPPRVFRGDSGPWFNCSGIGFAFLLRASYYFPENPVLIGGLLERRSEAVDFNEVRVGGQSISNAYQNCRYSSGRFAIEFD